MDVNTIMTVLAIAIAAFVYWRKGGNQASTEVITMLQTQSQLQKEEIHEMKAKAERQGDEIGQLKGRLSEKNDRIRDLEHILQNRNPEMTKFMEYITKVAERSEGNMVTNEMNWVENQKRNQAFMGILVEIKNFMGSMNQHMNLSTVAGKTSKV